MFNNDIETTKSNSKKKSPKVKLDNSNINIKKVIFLDEINNFNNIRKNNNNKVGSSKKNLLIIFLKK